MENTKENQNNNTPESTANNQSDNTNDEDTFNYTYQDDEIKNLCLECGVDMGPCNPRQLCGKTFCNNI
tara:strand:- start:250 stop:453 length:204 start_codon:yes stop_codon:yes gene_type:complete